MPLTALFDGASDLIEEPDMVAESLRPFVEQACEKQPTSVLLQEIRQFVDQGMATCSQSQLHAIAYYLNGNQLFMLESHVPGGLHEPLVVPAAPILRPTSPISTDDQDAFMRELESFSLE